MLAKDVSDIHAQVGRDACLAAIQSNVIPLDSTPDGSPMPRVPRIKFFLPSELRDYQPENGVILIGDCHIMRGEVFVIGGEPGVGKSRSATALAISGATGGDWFGLSVHRKFRTLIVQTENGRHRLQQEYSTMRCEELDDWIRVSEPPPFGLTLTNPEFQDDVRAALEAFKPECVILDPWNAATRDDKQRDYAETFEALRRLLPTGPDKPALGIVAHTRKPAANEKRTGGTGLMHILSGSHMLASLPRSVFVMIRGSEDEKCDSVIWCNPKNNNGPLVERTARRRHNGGFEPDDDFDWQEFEKPAEKRVIVRLEHLKEIFKNGDMQLQAAAHALATLTGINEHSAYNALKPDGKFKTHLTRKGNLVSFRP
jgi:RecA-family ATPase